MSETKVCEGQWYVDRAHHEFFLVIAIDETDGLIDVRDRYGDIDEFDLDEWDAMDLVVCSAPTEWWQEEEPGADEVDDADDSPSPLQVVGDHVVLVGIVLGRRVGRVLQGDYRARIVSANAFANITRHDVVLAFATHDHQLAADDPLAQRRVDRHAPHLATAHEVEVLVALDLRQAMLLDQLLDLRPAFFAVRFFLPLLLQCLGTRSLLGLSRLMLGDTLLFLRNALLVSLATRCWSCALRSACSAAFFLPNPAASSCSRNDMLMDRSRTGRSEL